MGQATIPKTPAEKTFRRKPRRSGGEEARPPRPAPAGDTLPASLWVSVVAHLVVLGLIVAAMTPYTYNLDDIKMTLYLLLGPALGLAALVGIARGTHPAPPRLIGAALLAYGVVIVASILASAFRWAGWIYLPFFVASSGFFLSALALGATARTARLFLTFTVLMLLTCELFGFFQYDLFGTGESALSGLYGRLYPRDRPVTQPSALQLLMHTFSEATRQRLMSTILNRDFYAGFCLLYVPLAVCVALTPGHWGRRAVGVVAAFLGFVSVFLCKSKGEYIFALAGIAFFVVLYGLTIRRPTVPTAYVAAWSGGIALFLGTLLFLNAPNLVSNLKLLSASVDSRRIIFAGAWGIFADHPILGSGPGTFKIYFPQYRSPDYFNHEISNLTIFAHNYILDILSETGLLGTLAYGTFALALAYCAFRALAGAAGTVLRLMLLAALTGLLGIYGNNMTSPSGRWPIGAVNLWTMLGFTLGLALQAGGWRPALGGGTGSRSARPAAGAWSPGRPGLRAGLLILGVAYVGGWGLAAREGSRYWRASVFYNQGIQRFDPFKDMANLELEARRAASGKGLDPERLRLTTLYMEQAVEAFRRALEIYPQHLSSYYKMGSAENFLSALKPAENVEHLFASLYAYQSLAGYAPDYAEIHYNLGIVYYQLAKAIETRPDAFFDNAALATPEARAAKTRELEKLSLESFKAMGSMSQKAEVLINLGRQYYNGGDYPLAQEIFAEGLSLYPDRLDLADSYTAASDAVGDAKGSVAGRRAAWLLRPSATYLLYDALRLSIEGGLDREFDELIREGLERNPVDPRLYEYEARAAKARGDAERLLKAVLKYRRLRGKEAELLLMGAEAAEQLGELSRARDLYATLLEANVASPIRERARAWLNAHP